MTNKRKEIQVTANIRTNLLFFLTSLFFYQPAFAIVSAPWVGEPSSGVRCSGPQGYGPFDYTERSLYPKDLNVVERAHFKPDDQNLKGTFAGNLDYTLRAFPNHHKALYSLILLQSRVQSQNNYNNPMPRAIECYFLRAINYSPKDSSSYLLYGISLHKRNKLERAFDAYKTAEKLNKDSIQIKYNLGLLLIDMNKFEEARFYAEQCYLKGFPLQGLKNKLKNAGYW